MASNPVRLSEGGLDRLPLPIGAVPHNVTGIKTVAVGDADNDGELEVLTTQVWTISLWQWEAGDLRPDGCFTVPFDVQAQNKGIFAALIADVDGQPGNEIMLVAAAADVRDDPWATDGRFFIYSHDGHGDYQMVADTSTGSLDQRVIRTPVDGAYAVENCLAVADLTGDGSPEIVLGLSFYTRTTRVYQLRGDPPSLSLLWEDEEDTADGNAILPYRMGDETVLMVGMGYGSPTRPVFHLIA